VHVKTSWAGPVLETDSKVEFVSADWRSQRQQYMCDHIRVMSVQVHIFVLVLCMILQ
jgi:hypothetical protein